MKDLSCNKYYQQNPHMFYHLLDIVNNHSKTYGKIITKNSEHELYRWIIDVTSYAISEDYPLKLRCYWIINGMEDFPICQNSSCGKKIDNPKQFIDKEIGFRKFCCKKCSALYDADNPQKAGMTVLEEYLEYAKIPAFNSYKDELAWILNTFPLKYNKVIYTDIFRCLQNDLLLKTQFVPHNATMATRCYCYLNDITEMPKCKNCGKLMNIDVYTMTSGFKLYCSPHCASIAEDTQTAKHKTNLERFGDEEYVRTKLFDCQSRATCLDRYGTERYASSQAHKDTMHKVSSRMTSRCYKTKKIHNSFHISKPEQDIGKKLIECFGEHNVISQYKDARYPFACDFYIKSLDLFIECNFHWTHGFHWFDETNTTDIKKLQKWKDKNTKYYHIAISVWTKSDLRKRQVAINNKIKYLVFWNQKEAEQWISQQETMSKQ